MTIRSASSDQTEKITGRVLSDLVVKSYARLSCGSRLENIGSLDRTLLDPLTAGNSYRGTDLIIRRPYSVYIACSGIWRGLQSRDPAKIYFLLRVPM